MMKEVATTTIELTDEELQGMFGGWGDCDRRDDDDDDCRRRREDDCDRRGDDWNDCFRRDRCW